MNLINKLTWKILKNHSKVKEMREVVSEIHQHIWQNGGFVDENGQLNNTELTENNQKVAENWTKSHNLFKKFFKI